MIEENKIIKISLCKRIAARTLDYTIIYLLGCIVSFVLPIYLGEFFYIGFALAIPFLWMPLEALLLSRWGSTPGKALFGLKVSDEQGKRLSFLDAFKESLSFGKLKKGKVASTPLSRKRSILAFATAALCLSASIGGTPVSPFSVNFNYNYATWSGIDGWIQFAVQERGLRVMLPMQPELQQMQFPVPNSKVPLQYNEYKSCQQGQLCYAVGYVDLPAKWKLLGSTKILQGALKLMVQRELGAELISQTMIPLKYPALDYHYKKGEESVRGRLILNNRTLYKMTINHPLAVTLSPDQTSFLDSFELGKS